jgi:hypothetical protein
MGKIAVAVPESIQLAETIHIVLVDRFLIAEVLEFSAPVLLLLGPSAP